MSSFYINNQWGEIEEKIEEAKKEKAKNLMIKIFPSKMIMKLNIEKTADLITDFVEKAISEDYKCKVMYEQDEIFLNILWDEKN